MLQPRKPEKVTAEELHWLPQSGQGIRYFLADDESEEEMTYDTLAYCVRHDPAFGFVDDDTTSDAELWSDVICPAILDGRIERAIWGTITEITGR